MLGLGVRGVLCAHVFSVVYETYRVFTQAVREAEN